MLILLQKNACVYRTKFQSLRSNRNGVTNDPKLTFFVVSSLWELNVMCINCVMNTALYVVCTQRMCARVFLFSCIEHTRKPALIPFFIFCVAYLDYFSLFSV